MEPRLVFPIAGTTFEGRQSLLNKVAAHINAGAEYNRTNDNIRFVPEPDNKHDKHAIRIDMATKWDGTNFTDMKSVGYVPRRYCHSCGKLIPAKEYNSQECTNCQTNLRGFESSYLNLYLSRAFFQTPIGEDKRPPVDWRLSWIGTSKKDEDGHMGVRIAFIW